MIGQPSIDQNPETALERIEIEKVIVHPDFDEDKSFAFDVLIVVLAGQSNRPTITLNLNPEIPSASGDPLIVMGTGQTDEKESERSEDLQVLEVSYLPYEECLTALEKHSDDLTEDQICAFSTVDKGGACYGDSGGPLVILGDTPGNDREVGIVSWYVLLL